MKLFYHLLQLPPFLLLLLCMLAFSLVAVTGTVIARKYVNSRVKKGRNEIVGLIFGVLGGFYALLLSFVVFLVWDSFNQAQNNSNLEGSLAKGLYRDIRYFPDSAKIRPLMVAYLNYVHEVLDNEYPAMERLDSLPPGYRRSFNQVFIKMELQNTNDLRIDQMFRHLNELATSRSLRQLYATSAIPVEVWYPLMAGTLIIMLLATLLDVQSYRLHITVNGLLGAFIGLVIYIIITLDHPFTGKIRIDPVEYKTILKMSEDNA